MTHLAPEPSLSFDPDTCEMVQCLSVVALPDPGALARTLEPFAKLGLIPLSVNSRFFSEAGQLAIDIQIAGMTEEQGLRIANQIRSLPITLQVVTGRKYLVPNGPVLLTSLADPAG